MAKKVFSGGQAHRIAYNDLGNLSKDTLKPLLHQFYDAIEAIQESKGGYHSIIIEFGLPFIHCEHEFEALIWRFLQAVHDEDSLTYGWNAEVESDPSSKSFSFSIKGEAFYIIGMHPMSSRKARQTETPILVFNLHSQFEKLRDSGAYETVRDKIRKRDIAYAGNMNPMLEDFLPFV